MDIASQVVQIAGMLLILSAFILLQVKKLRATSVTYLVMNLVGASLLAFTAILNLQWGFIILELVWAMVALGGLLHVMQKRRS